MLINVHLFDILPAISSRNIMQSRDFSIKRVVTLIIVSLQNGLSLLIAEHYRSAVEWLSCHN